MAAKPVPDNQTLRPHLTVRDGAAAIDFYRRAFGAVELFRLVEPSGKLGHAEIRIGDTIVMLNEEYPDFGALSPDSLGGSPVAFLIYVDNADQAIERATKAGATLLRPVADQFYGDRSGMVACPFGYRWTLGNRAEEVDPAEMQRRFTKMMSGG
ncbi:MAG: VOC family protein [Alphaproteobacteria bacterium]|nr:VOC family protein [Alphaproteobacteria bacterium]